jgi:predicted RNA polymerase sigma factor
LAAEYRRLAAALYDVLAALAPGPMVALNRTVTVAMVRGPAAALAELNDAAADPALSGHHRVDAVRAHLLDELGDRDAAREYYLRAAQRTRSLPEQRYLLARAMP